MSRCISCDAVMPNLFAEDAIIFNLDIRILACPACIRALPQPNFQYHSDVQAIVHADSIKKYLAVLPPQKLVLAYALHFRAFPLKIFQAAIILTFGVYAPSLNVHWRPFNLLEQAILLHDVPLFTSLVNCGLDPNTLKHPADKFNLFDLSLKSQNPLWLPYWLRDRGRDYLSAYTSYRQALHFQSTTLPLIQSLPESPDKMDLMKELRIILPPALPQPQSVFVAAAVVASPAPPIPPAPIAKPHSSTCILL